MAQEPNTGATRTRRDFVKSAAAVALTTGLFGATGCARAAETTAAMTTEATTNTETEQARAVSGSRPNVLLILADDLGWSDIGCYGGEIATPTIDALAQDGLRFTQFYNSARCCPSRAALLTGLNPHQAGFPLMSGTLVENCATLPEVLKSAGYATYMVGKWHLGNQKGPTVRGFDEFYGMLGGFNSYWQEDPYYTRLPEGRPKRDYKPGEFYSTNVFGDYAIDFIKSGEAAKKPWFMYLSFNAPHFPLHAPEATIAKYEALYREKGWDAISDERLARQKKLGIIPKDLARAPRGVTPENFINKQTGWADKEIPAWNTLDPERQADLARRMAVYAACVDLMDHNIGRVVSHLKQTGQWDNTLVFFLSDNGACAEWDPYGFDKLDSTLNIVHKGDDLKQVGAPESYISYGSGWAKACDTPWRLFKHYTQEGGIRTPLIVHWPKGLKTKGGALTNQPGFLYDFMPTLVELCGAQYSKEHNNTPVQPMEGVSIAPTFAPGGKLKPRLICVEHEGNRMARDTNWKLVAIHDRPWELYDLSKDPVELHDLATSQPTRVKEMAAKWDAWALRCNVVRPNNKPGEQSARTPQIANCSFTVRCDVTLTSANVSGVVVAQGGAQRGYALYLKAGKPAFGVRENNKLTEIVSASAAPTDKFALEARLAKDGTMTLLVNNKSVATGKAPGLIQIQPQDGLSIGEDTQSAVGDYAPPHPLAGKVENVRVTPQETSTSED